MKKTLIEYTTTFYEGTIDPVDREIVTQLADKNLAAEMLVLHYKMDKEIASLAVQELYKQRTPAGWTGIEADVKIARTKYLEIPTALCAHLWDLCNHSHLLKGHCLKLLQTMYTINYAEATSALYAITKVRES